MFKKRYKYSQTPHFVSFSTLDCILCAATLVAGLVVKTALHLFLTHIQSCLRMQVFLPQKSTDAIS